MQIFVICTKVTITKITKFSAFLKFFFYRPSDLYPVLMDRVQQLCQQQVDFLSMTAQQRLAACALIGVLETVTCVAADASRMDAEQRQK